MASLYELVNQIAMLLAARNPTWSIQSGGQTGAPDSAAAGVQLANSPRAMISVALRETPHYFTARYRVTAGDASTTYNLSVNGNAIAGVTGEANVEDIVQELLTDIAAVPAIVALVNVATEGTPEIDTVILTGKAEADLTIVAGVSGGAGTITLTQDATAASVRIWGKPKSGGPNWLLVRDGTFEGLDYRGLIERLDVAGLDRLYIEVYDEDGTVTCTVGPATTEV